MSTAHAPKTPAALAALTLGALGVVYGDIGTSPLYARSIPNRPGAQSRFRP